MLRSRVFSCWSRAAMLRDRSERPPSADRNSSGVFWVSSPRVFSERASRSVSIDSERSARPLNASTTSYGDVVRCTGISAPFFSWPRPAGSRPRYIAPSSVLTLIAAAVSRPKSDALLDLERDPDVVAVQLDRLHLADPDAGDPHLVVGLEPAGLGERGVVGVAAADQRQVLGLEGGEDERDDHGEADRPDDHGVPLAEGNAHPRSHLGDVGGVVERAAP